MRTAYKPFAVTILLAGIMLLAGCRQAASGTPTVNPEEILTQAAGTAMIQLTEVAALTPSPAPATDTPQPTNTPPPTQPPAPTEPPAPTNTTAPPSAPVTQGDDNASFVEDVTIPDGTGATPGVKFEKVWRIKNTGVTTWTTSYSLDYIDGERMGAPDRIPMPKEVRPGETVDIAVTLTAPDKPGSYQTFFRLRNANGQYFRLDGTGDLGGKINVGAGATATVEPTATVDPAATETDESDN